MAHVTDWRSERTAYTADGKKVQVDLAQAVKHWPTPIAHAGSNRRTKPTPAQAAGKAGMQLADQVGGSLNPTWVEWLMGWPLGWTDLKPLETDRFQRWLELHGRH